VAARTKRAASHMWCVCSDTRSDSPKRCAMLASRIPASASAPQPRLCGCSMAMQITLC
jgi:hypothetical protein